MDTRVATARHETAVESGGRSLDRLYELTLAELERENVQGDVLDFGAGQGNLARRLRRSSSYARVVAVDLVRYGAPPEGVELVQHDLNDPLPFPDASFDAVAGIGILEYLENPYAVGRELLRVLKPGGTLVLTVPNGESVRSLVSLVLRGRPAALAADGSRGALHGFARSDLVRVLVRAGFGPPRFFFSGRGALPRATGVTWQAVSLGRLHGLRTSDDLGCVVRKAAGR